MKKFLTIAGARPNLIKLDNKLKQVLVWTGQHYDKEMKDIFFSGLKLPKPKYDLGVTELGEMTDKISKIIEKEKPDYVIVYGDTRSALAGTMSAYYNNVKVIHIEAGMRSGNDNMIEERIRKIIDDIACIHFTVCQEDKENLEMDYKKTQVYNVGAVQIDTMRKSVFPTKLPKDAYKYSVLTIHRDFNVNKENLEEIFSALETWGKKVEFYCHPRTALFIKKNKLELPKNITILPPCSYKQMINRLAYAERVLTDSGGIQLEAYYLRRPCVTLRYDTEWHETANSGWNFLTGPSKERILLALNNNIRGKGEWEYYGVGKAKENIRLYLENL